MAVIRACKVMYLAACVLTNTRVQKIATPEGYAYAVEAMQLIDAKESDS